jgi:phage-related minor tail protein
MAEELGRIEKMPAENYRKGRKLYFVPLLYSGSDMPVEYIGKYEKYWDQVERQVADLVAKLGDVHRVYHELVAETGETGEKTVKELSERSHRIIRAYLDKQAVLEAVEDMDALTEFMDWSRCLMVGLQNPGVVRKVYDAYVEAGKKRNEAIARRIDETLKENESAILLMREEHQVQFPNDIQVFYVAPPALDEIKRWLRERESQAGASPAEGEAGDTADPDSPA